MLSGRAISILIKGSTAFVLTFLVAQTVRPQLANAPGAAELKVSPDVEEILKTSCYACHSSQTRLSWFDQIVPAYQLVVHDVQTARKHLNFSEHGRLPTSRQRAVLFEAVNQIQLGAMPPPRYTLLHPEAVISPNQLAVLWNSLLPVQREGSRPSDNTAAADAQYQSWIAGSKKGRSVQASPNGIAFLPEYKDWKAISTTDRVESSTLRVILGNDIAIQAIAANRINPWPDGATLAKVAWQQQSDGNGTSESGLFLQVAFMIKDATRYKSTAGWGWAEWVGPELKPYGESPGFATECVSCHAPLRENDSVFTMPIAPWRSR